MSKVDGGFLIAEMLRCEGVKYVFSVSGGVLNPIYRACEELGIGIVHTRHEAAAAFMADGWARTTGQPGVVLVTLGPGVTNTITGIFTAYRATSPILVLAGQAGQSTRDMDPGMSVDPLPLVTPITKWAKSVGETPRIPEYLAGAFRHAISGRPGPVFLEFPGDILRATIDRKEVNLPAPESSRSIYRLHPDPESIVRAIELISRAERPIIIAGSGVFWSGAGEELRTFVEQHHLPFFLSRAGRGVVPEDHPLYFGPGYLPANPILDEAFKETDLLLLIGHRLDFDLEFGNPQKLNPKANIIQLDIEASEIGRYRAVEASIVADAMVTLHALAKTSPHPHLLSSRWLSDLEEARRNWLTEMDEAATSSSVPMHPLRFLKGISDVLPKESVVVTSHGNIDFWADVHFQVFRPGGYLRAGQSGSLGAEVPYGLAAKLAHPDDPVVVVVGDGGFGYHCMELDTAARYNAPFLIAIGNDASWGAIALPQEREYGRAIATGLLFRNYERIAEVLGGYGELVSSPDEVAPAVRRALESKLPSVLNVPIDAIESRYMYELSK